MNMQQIEENNKAQAKEQAKEQKNKLELFLEEMHMLTIKHGIVMFAGDVKGIWLTDAQAFDSEYWPLLAGRIHYRGRDAGYVAEHWHPDLTKKELGDE